MEESDVARAVRVRLALSSPMTYRWHCSVDIPGNGSRLFDDRIDDRAHS